MNFQDTTFTSLNVDSNTGMITLGIASPGPWPQDLRSGMWLKLVPAKAACPRSSDMQDLVDRCEPKTKAPEKGWRKHTNGDMTYVMDENDLCVAMIPATWWLYGQTDEERATEMRQRRESYFTNVPLLVNAKRMFDLLDRIRIDGALFSNKLAEEMDMLIKEIKTQQWKPEQPTQG